MSIERPGLEQIDGSGATAGQVPVWNGTDVWEPGDLPAVPVVLVPLTTEIDGVPELVWDDDNQLVMTEAD